ncbi:MAG: bi-domain-containing oxidoreductase [Flavobacteriales bacterium]
MKQLIQSYKTGELGIFEVPAPVCGDNGVVIRTKSSLVSAGTEKMIVDLAKKSLIGKAQARPDLVKQVITKMKQEGIKNTLEKVFTKLDTPIPLGYSCVGEVLEVGRNVTGISVGDRVACGGAGYANHSEINYVPRNLFVKVPEKVSDEDAAFVTVGAIALQGVRQTAPTIGERIAVIGLGLLGQLTVQLLKANGCKVLGSDPDPKKQALALELGADAVCGPDELLQAAKIFSDGRGVDATVISASTSSDQPVADAGEISRMKGRVVIVGLVGMNIPREYYYKKELELKLSMAYGPGRYDAQYEEQGIDYPFAHVRWTEQRNFEAFLGLIDEGKITPQKLLTHRIGFDKALDAYDLLEGKVKEYYLGIVLKYNSGASDSRKPIAMNNNTVAAKGINVGLIGAGNFTKGVILPNLGKAGGFNLTGVCTATGVSAHSTGKKYNFKFITTDANELIQHKDINTIFITTRHNDHGEKVLLAMKEGKHIFVEKPLTLDENELETIRVKYNKAEQKPILQVGYNRRFSPLVQRMKTTLGKLPASINYRVNAGVIPLNSWIQDPAVGGGRILGELCHFVDACLFLAGSMPVSVFASCVKKTDQSIPDEDNISVVLTFENGSIATISYTAYGNPELPKEFIEVFAPNIAMQMDNYRELTIYSGSSKNKSKSSNQDKGFKGEFDAFAEAVKSGKPAISFEEIYAVSKVTFKVLESLRSGVVVRV